MPPIESARHTARLRLLQERPRATSPATERLPLPDPLAPPPAVPGFDAHIKRRDNARAQPARSGFTSLSFPSSGNAWLVGYAPAPAPASEPPVHRYKEWPGVLHRELVEEAAAAAPVPQPVPLDAQLVEEASGEEPEHARSVEVLFQPLGDAPGLCACARLEELSLMNAGLQRIPPEVQHVRGTLRLLSLPGNAISAIELPSEMPRLETLLLHTNHIEEIVRPASKAGGWLRGARALSALDSCPALRRLWLSTNRLRALDGLDGLRGLRELWLQDNPISAVGELRGLRSLQVLSLAATHVVSLDALEPLCALPLLHDLACDDPHFGAAPVAETEG